MDFYEMLSMGQQRDDYILVMFPITICNLNLGKCDELQRWTTSSSLFRDRGGSRHHDPRAKRSRVDVTPGAQCDDNHDYYHWDT